MPRALLHTLTVSSIIDALEDGIVVTCDIPRAFLQTDMPHDEEVWMKLE